MVVLNESGTKSLCGQAVWLLVDCLFTVSDSDQLRRLV